MAAEGMNRFNRVTDGPDPVPILHRHPGIDAAVPELRKADDRQKKAGASPGSRFWERTQTAGMPV